MKEIWNVIKKTLGWIIGLGGVFFGIMSFFNTYGVMPKIFGGILLLVGLYIIPKIYNYLNLGFKVRNVVIAYLVGLFGLAFTIDNKPPKPIDENVFYITASKLNIRKGSGKDYEVLYQLNKGDKVAIIEKGENWSKISSSKGEGYASTKYLSNTNPKDSGENDIWTYIIIGAFVFYAIFSKKGSSNSGGATKPKSKPTQRQSPKPKKPEIRFICKDCGRDFRTLSDLTSNSCHKSPSGKHRPFEGGIQDRYICEDCGRDFRTLSDLTSNSCHKSPTGKHRPFIGGIQEKYYCKHCGRDFRTLSDLTSNSCHKSPTGKHQPLH